MASASGNLWALCPTAALNLDSMARCISRATQSSLIARAVLEVIATGFCGRAGGQSVGGKKGQPGVRCLGV